MVTRALVLALALAACSPPPDAVDEIPQALGSEALRVTLRIPFDGHWDTVITKPQPCDVPCLSGLPAASAYLNAQTGVYPVFNMFLSDSPTGGPIYSGYRAPDLHAYLGPSCGVPGGPKDQYYEYPQVNGLTPGVTYYVWLMLRCSNGNWPVSSPPESEWRFSFVMPPGNAVHDFVPVFGGFNAWKSWWGDWFQGCTGVPNQGANTSPIWEPTYPPQTLAHAHCEQQGATCNCHTGAGGVQTQDHRPGW